jgi:hypothetical protein
MRTTGLSESGFARVALISGATAAVMISLLFVKPIYSAVTNPKAVTGMRASQPADQQLKTEPASFVGSPSIEANPQFFFGSGDGSGGYYAERPEPTPSTKR